MHASAGEGVTLHGTCARGKCAPGARAGENPRAIEPVGSIARETLRDAQGDMHLPS